MAEPDAVDRAGRRLVVGTLFSLVAAAILVIVILAVTMGGDDTSETSSSTTPTSETPSSSPVPDGADASASESTGATVDAAPETTTERSTAPGSTVAPTDSSTSVASPSTTIAPPAPPEGGTPETSADAWTVSAIVSGDTLEVTGPDGLQTVRLIGVEAPPEGECYAEESVKELRALAVGPLVLTVEGAEVDDDGRWLRYVETADGVDIGGEMVLRGAARAVSSDPDASRSFGYQQREVQAENEMVGMWATGRCPELTGEGPG